MDITEEQYAEAFRQEQEHYKEIDDHNKAVIERICAEDSTIDELLRDVEVTGKMKIVDEPTGDDQNEELGIFNKVFVDQYSVGDSGDSFAGTIYAEFNEDKWLSIPYRC